MERRKKKTRKKRKTKKKKKRKMRKKKKFVTLNLVFFVHILSAGK